MPDILDDAQGIIDAETDSLIRDAKKRAAEIPVGEPGICDSCEEEKSRLVRGLCGRCRDEHGI